MRRGAPQRRNDPLDEFVRENFTAETYRLRAESLRQHKGEPEFPLAVKLVAPSYAETTRIWNAFEDRLDPDADYLPICFPVSGFVPKDGEPYTAHLRMIGKTMFAFPAERRKQLKKDEWLDGVSVVPGSIKVHQEPDGSWSGRHPLYGGRFKSYRIQLTPDAEGNAVLDMESLVLIPVRTSGGWVLTRARDAKKFTPEALVRFDQGLYTEQMRRREERRSYQSAPEFPIWGRRRTIFEVADSPVSREGQPATSIEGLEKNAWEWFNRAEAFEKDLVVALHPDEVDLASHKEGFTEAELVAKGIKDEFGLTEAELARAVVMAQQTREAYPRAIEWAKKWLLRSIQRLYSRQKDNLLCVFRIPEPQGRKFRPGPPLISLSRANLGSWDASRKALREHFVEAVRESLKPRPAPRPKSGASAKPAEPKRPKPKAKKPEAKADEKKPAPAASAGSAGGFTIADRLNGKNPATTAQLADLKRAKRLEAKKAKDKKDKKDGAPKRGKKGR